MDTTNKTTHFSKDRTSRVEVLESVGGYGNELAKFWVDKGHPDGPEWHILTDNAIIVVKNANTDRLITVKFARIGQIRQFDGMVNELNGKVFFSTDVPKRVMDKAYFRQTHNYNNK